MKRKLITVLIIFLRTCKTVSIKPCINREDKRKSSKFSYKVIVVTQTMKFLAVVKTHSIYHGCSTQKMFWENNFTPVNMRSFGRCNVRKHKEINNGGQYIALDIYFKIDYLC